MDANDPNGHLDTIDDLRKRLAAANRSVVDRTYMMAAMSKMLGPKGQQVWKMWADKGIKRLHFDWGPEGLKAQGEEAAQLYLDIEEACENAVPLTDEELANF